MMKGQLRGCIDQALAVEQFEGAIEASVGGARAVAVGEPRLPGAGGAAALQWLCELIPAGGLKALNGLAGEHAVALAGPDAVWLLTDRLGTVPLYYAQPTGGGIAFDTSASRLAGRAGVDAGLDPQALYDYLYFHMIPGPRTVYRGVRRLLPGTCLYWNGREDRLETYWQPVYEPQPGDRDQLAARFREAVFAAVDRAREGGRVGAFLSGGTDSSTLVGALARDDAASTRAYSIGFDVPGYDETDYARLVARHFGVTHRAHYLTPEEVAAAVPDVAAWLDQPFGNASIVPAQQCALLAAEDGVPHLLGGDGGDELFGGNARYAKQQVFELYGRLPQGLRSRLGPLAERLPAAGPARKLRSYVAQAEIPLPDRLETYNLLERIGPETVLAPGLLEAADSAEPRSLLRDAYTDAAASDYVNRLLALDLRFTLADNDLVKVRQATAMQGVSASFPFLDDDVVSLSLALPADWKVRRDALRPFFKEALRDFLPQEVLAKRKHGFGLPFGIWLAETPSLNRLASDALHRLEERGILRPGFARQLMGRELNRHPGYYGAFVWVLMMLGRWLDAHGVPDDALA